MLPGRVVIDSFLLWGTARLTDPSVFRAGSPSRGFAHPQYSHYSKSNLLDLLSLVNTDLVYTT